VRVVVTGSAGLIGWHVVEALLKRGDGVHVLVNLTTGRREQRLAPTQVRASRGRPR
jgi:nucleoside-diphosphate-sugar epimerase